MTRPRAGDACPRCSVPLTGLATRCWAGPHENGCGWTLAEWKPDVTARGDAGTASPDAGSPAGVSRPVHLSLPFDVLVSANKRSGGMTGWTTAEYRHKKAAAEAVIMEQCRALAFPSGPVRVVLTFYPPDRRRRDYHNLPKALFDAMSEHVYTDDSQVKHWIGTVEEVDREPRVEITVESLAMNEDDAA